MEQTLGIPELQQAVGAADPGALLVPPRLLRRVIKQDRGIPGIGLQVPHRKSYAVSRDALLTIADRDELGVPAGRELPESLVLLACPEDWLASLPRDRALLRFWRLLFHAHIDQALGKLRAAGRLDDAAVRALVQRVGPVEFEEACHVLRQENFLLPPGGLFDCFAEFAAVYLELKYFTRPWLCRYFPAIDDRERVEAVLAELVDAEALCAATRPEGAPEPLERMYEEGPAEEGEEEGPAEPEAPSPERCRKLLALADKVGARGNVVRAAILRTRAAESAPPDLAGQAHAGARADIDRLARRLQAALELHDREAEEWRHALPVLFGPAAHGIWPPSARLLYDLQKVCVDYERDIYAVDLVEWAVSSFRRPIKRFLPLQADVLLVKHLRSAAKRLAKVRIPEEDRRRLGILMRSAVHHCEERLRQKIRPVLDEVIEEVGLCPTSYAEQVAKGKLIEELLDRVTNRGFLTMGDVRDALSRNQLKLPDLRGPKELILGDQLIRANRKLAGAIDGVYHRGEFYLRWLHRFSAALFGTRLGRWLTLYFIIPFGGAFALLVFLQELVHVGHDAMHWLQGTPAAEETAIVATGPNLTSPWVVGVVGVFLFLLLHVPEFRARVWSGAKTFFRGLKRALFDWPAAFFSLPAVRRFLDSRPVALFRRHALRPLLAAGVAASFCWLGHATPKTTLAVSGATFVVAAVLFNSKLGLLAEEAATDWVARNWDWLRVDVLPGLLNLITVAFREALDRLERVIYTVDEWLRFRPGDSKGSLYYKPVLGLFWFVLTYLFRVIINLFVEPTVNPLKHFPWVTVGAKLILPLFPLWMAAGTGALGPFLGTALAGTIALTAFGLLPGIFGFIVWEFKENWRLYRANRPAGLRPVMIGHHGETMPRLLKPGFHSGTLPKLYTKLRKAERRNNGRAFHKHQEALHHLKERIRHFVERNLLLVLQGSRGWNRLRLYVGTVTAATNRVRVEVCSPEFQDRGLWLAFEERSGWLVAGVTRPGWLDLVSERQAAALRNALAGLYKYAGVSLVREQVESCLSADARSYTLEARRLVVWPDGDFSQGIVYDLRQDRHIPEGEATGRDDEIAAREESLLFQYTPVTWKAWVETWERDQDGKLPPPPLLPGTRLLPVEALAPAACEERGVAPAVDH